MARAWNALSPATRARWQVVAVPRHPRASEELSAEVSSAGWFKPVGEAYPAPSLLQRFHAAGVPITTASDAHKLERVAAKRPEVRELVRSAGYDTLCAFDARTPREVPL